MFAWLKRNWGSVLFSLAVLVTFAVQDSIRRDADRALRRAAVEHCIRSAPAPALSAAFQLEYSSVREQDKASLRFNALSAALLETIHTPKNLKSRKSLVEIEFKTVEGRLIADFTDTAKKLQRKGCEESYPKI